MKKLALLSAILISLNAGSALASSDKKDCCKDEKNVYNTNRLETNKENLT